MLFHAASCLPHSTLSRSLSLLRFRLRFRSPGDADVARHFPARAAPRGAFSRAPPRHRHHLVRLAVFETSRVRVSCSMILFDRVFAAGLPRPRRSSHGDAQACVRSHRRGHGDLMCVRCLCSIFPPRRIYGSVRAKPLRHRCSVSSAASAPAPPLSHLPSSPSPFPSPHSPNRVLDARPGPHPPGRVGRTKARRRAQPQGVPRHNCAPAGDGAAPEGLLRAARARAGGAARGRPLPPVDGQARGHAETGPGGGPGTAPCRFLRFCFFLPLLRCRLSSAAAPLTHRCRTALLSSSGRRTPEATARLIEYIEGRSLAAPYGARCSTLQLQAFGTTAQQQQHLLCSVTLPGLAAGWSFVTPRPLPPFHRCCTSSLCGVLLR